jgi:hypothetical protein
MERSLWFVPMGVRIRNRFVKKNVLLNWSLLNIGTVAWFLYNYDEPLWNLVPSWSVCQGFEDIFVFSSTQWMQIAKAAVVLIQEHYFIWQLESLFIQTVSHGSRQLTARRRFILPWFGVHAFYFMVLRFKLNFTYCIQRSRCSCFLSARRHAPQLRNTLLVCMSDFRKLSKPTGSD